MITADSLPDDVATLKALVLAGQAAQLAAEAKARNLEAEVRARTLLIEQMKFTIAKLKHEQYGPSSERSSVLEQLELELADLEEDASEAEAEAQLAAERARAQRVEVQPFERRRPARRPFPAHLPRERIVHPAPVSCPCCGGDRLRKIGEDVTETLELIPRQWKVIQHVREKFSCRACEAISQPPAPFHAIARGRAGPRLLAHMLFAKYGLHLPLNRQSMTYAHEGIALDVSTLADWIGAAAATLRPLVDVLRARRKFFELARLKKAPIAIEAVEKIDTLFAIEREINGLSPQQRAAVRNERSRPLVEGLHAFLRERRAKLSGKSETARAIDYSLKRWEVFTRFLDDGQLCMSNNAAERELRAVAVGRKNWTFAGSDEGGRRAAAVYT